MAKPPPNLPGSLPMRSPSYIPWEGQHMWHPSELSELPNKHPEMAGAFVEGEAEYFGKCIYLDIDDGFIEARDFVFMATGYEEASRIHEQKARAIALLRPNLIKQVYRLDMSTKLNNPLRSLITIKCIHPWDESKANLRTQHIYRKRTRNIIKNRNLF
jgi:hypothetical protein